VEKLKKLKSYFSDGYNFLKTLFLEDTEKILEKAREREICLLKERFAELHQNKRNQKYNVFVYDTILYPPDSTSYPNRN
jgi:hypothetical protein